MYYGAVQRFTKFLREQQDEIRDVKKPTLFGEVKWGDEVRAWPSLEVFMGRRAGGRVRKTGVIAKRKTVWMSYW